MLKKLLIWMLVPVLLTSCQIKPSTSHSSIEGSPQPSYSETSNEIPAPATAISKWDIETLVEIDKDSIQQIANLEVLQGYESGVIFMDFHPEGQMLASSGIDGYIRLWDLKDGNEIASIKHGLEGMGVSFHPADHFLATGGTDSYVRIWNNTTTALIHEFEGHAWGILDVAYSPDGLSLVSSSRDHSIRIWDINREQEIFILHGHAGDVYTVAFSPDGSILASGSKDGFIYVWDMNTGKKVTYFVGSEEEVYYVTFSPDGTLLASCSGGYVGRDNAVRLFDTESWEKVRILGDQSTSVIGCEFSRDGTLLIILLQEGKLLIWDYEAEEILTEFEVAPERASTLAISQDGCLIAVGDFIGNIHLYGVQKY